MNYSICLDPTTVNNFNVANLSPNGFSIYTNLDFTTPLQTGIPFDQLFTSPLGTCPYIIDLPQGVTQIIVIDNCIQPPVSSDLSGNAVIANCCYAILDIPQEPVPWCEECNLSFNVFNTSSIGQIIAGTLSSTCGTVTDYTIGWYRDGDYSSPEFISGFGNAFLPYDNLHPLTGQQAVPCLGGNWEGIIHDIAIGGITYSSIAGTANGVPIPFESCFDTVVVNPLTCDNGFIVNDQYSHWVEFNSTSPGATSSPLHFNFVLGASTKYFAYNFKTFLISDELEIKWISGDPSATSNPSLYSQPIYLEKVIVGNITGAYTGMPGGVSNIIAASGLLTSQIDNTFNGSYSNVNNIWPKTYPINNSSAIVGDFSRTLSFTSLETSSNPSLPDRLEITITPNPTNNNTKFTFKSKCLTAFDCSDCYFENWPNNLPKIKKITINKNYSPCSKGQNLKVLLSTGSCNPITNEWDKWMPASYIKSYIHSNASEVMAFNSDLINYPNGFTYTPPPPAVSPNDYIFLNSTKTCGETSNIGPNSTQTQCAPPSTGTITITKTPSQIKITCTLLSDYSYYVTKLNALHSQVGANNPLFNPPIPCTANSIDLTYYQFIQFIYPQQGASINCGDNSIIKKLNFHLNDLFNIQYNSTTKTITIPVTSMVNCYNPVVTPCDSCYAAASAFVATYNGSINFSSTFTTTVGAKYNGPFDVKRVVATIPTVYTSSFCRKPWYVSTLYNRYFWYSSHTIPFISSSTSPTGWTNLPSLGAFINCSNRTSSYPVPVYGMNEGLNYSGHTFQIQSVFPHLSSSFNYAFGPGNSYSTNDFLLYSHLNLNVTGGLLNNNLHPYSYIAANTPCPTGSLIYSYLGGVATVYDPFYFLGGVAPTLNIDP